MRLSTISCQIWRQVMMKIEEIIKSEIGKYQQTILMYRNDNINYMKRTSSFFELVRFLLTISLFIIYNILHYEIQEKRFKT